MRVEADWCVYFKICLVSFFVAAIALLFHLPNIKCLSWIKYSSAQNVRPFGPGGHLIGTSKKCPLFTGRPSGNSMLLGFDRISFNTFYHSIINIIVCIIFSLNFTLSSILLVSFAFFFFFRLTSFCFLR